MEHQGHILDFFPIFTKTNVHLFSDQNGVVVRTDYIINSRQVGADPVAVYYLKNTYNLELRSHEYVVPAVLCEQGKILTDITGYIHWSLLILQHTPMSPY